MKVRVEIWTSAQAQYFSVREGVANGLIADYTMNHNDAAERRVLGEQCRNAFEAGQCVVTYPVKG